MKRSVIWDFNGSEKKHMRSLGGSMAEWSEYWTCNSEAPSSSPALTLSPKFRCSASWFAFGQLGFLNPVKFDLDYLFQALAGPYPTSISAINTAEGK